MTSGSRRNETFRTDARVVRRTQSAVLLQDPHDGTETWIPLSCIIEMTEIDGADGIFRIRMARWIAESKGLTE
jgi:hypothetical protein